MCLKEWVVLEGSQWTTGRVPEVITYLNFPSFVHFLNNQPLVHVTAHLQKKKKNLRICLYLQFSFWALSEFGEWWRYHLKSPEVGMSHAVAMIKPYTVPGLQNLESEKERQNKTKF